MPWYTSLCAQLFWYGRQVWLEEGCCTCDGPCKRPCGQGAPSAAVNKVNEASDLMWAVDGGREHEKSGVQALSREGGGSLDPCVSEESRQPLLNGLHSPQGPGALPRVAVCRRVAITAACIVGLAYCAVGLCVFAVGLWWRSGSLWSLLAPALCVAVLLAAFLARHCKKRGWYRTSTHCSWWDMCKARVQTALDSL